MTLTKAEIQRASRKAVKMSRPVIERIKVEDPLLFDALVALNNVRVSNESLIELDKIIKGVKRGYKKRQD